MPKQQKKVKNEMVPEEEPLTFGVGIEFGKVVLFFTRPIGTLRLTKKEAEDLIKLIANYSRQLGN